MSNDGPEQLATPDSLRARAKELDDRAADIERRAHEASKPTDKDPYAQYNPTRSYDYQTASRLRDEATQLRAEAKARENEIAQKLSFDNPDPIDPTVDTGHYDDGHSLGWNNGVKSSDVDTGHYDDGHAFGWNRPEPSQPDEPADPEPIDPGPEHGLFIDGLGALASPPPPPKPRAPVSGSAGRGLYYAPTALSAVALNYVRQSRSAQILVIVAALIAAVFGTEMLRAGGAQPQALAAPTASAPATAAATAVASRATAAAPLDPCTLVTAQEAAAILDGSAITLRPNTPPGPQCTYTPGQKIVFSFQEKSRTAQIRIESVVITAYTGSQATSRFAAKQSPKPTDRDDQTVSGVGDSAVYGGAASDLSVLRGTSYVNVTTTGDRDWGDGNVRYEDVHQKYLSVLIAFAKAALARMP